MYNEKMQPRILRGVTRTVRILLLDTDGNAVDLSLARKVVVTVSLDGAGKSNSYTPEFTIGGDVHNVVSFVWYADMQHRAGRYTIELVADYGDRNKARVNWHRGYGIELVEYNVDESGALPETLELDSYIDLTGSFSMNGVGMSAYEQWLASEYSEGYEQSVDGFMTWMQRPAVEAAITAASEMEIIQQRAEEDHTRAGEDHTQAGSDHEQAGSDHSRAESDHTRAGEDHTQAGNDHTRAESDHTRAEEDHTQAGNDHTRAGNDHDTAGEDHTQAGNDHSRAESDHTRAGEDHTQAGSDHEQAGSDHSRAESDHTRAEEDHTRAGSDHEQAGSDHSRAESDHTRAEEDHQSIANKVDKSDLLDGSLVPKLAENLRPFEERDNTLVISVQGDAVRTTAGDESINAASGAKLMSIVPTSDLTPEKLIISGFNQLRLRSNNGPAIAVGTGWAFPVPACQFGEYGSAKQNNGILFTDNNNANLGYSSTGRPTVRFLAGTAAPEAVTDGVDMNANSSYYHDDSEHGLRFYLPPSIGWIIVSGITWANTCAHMAWSRLYNAFISPESVSDAGTIINLTSLGTLRCIGNDVQDRADRTDDTHMLLTTKVGRVSSPVWTNTADEVAEGGTQTYLHVITVSGIKAGGAAAIEGQTQILTVDGTTVSYRDANENALEGALRYELAAPTTASKAVSTIVSSLHDWGIDILVSSAGTAMVTWQYSQGIPDSLAALVGGGFENAMAVIAHLLCDMDSRINTIRKSLDGGLRSLTVDNLRVINSIDRFDNSGNRIIQSDVAPNVMADFIGQLWHYKDSDHDEWYFATGTTAVSQWKKISLT